MAENLDIGITAKAWADIVIQKWEQKIIRLKIKKSGDLMNSFLAYVNREANGNPSMIEFTFNYYGKFVDMGAGRGVKAGEHEGTNRSPKPWYSRTFYSQLQVLPEILAGKYAEKGKMAIIETLSD